MIGWILYRRNLAELIPQEDHAVLRLLQAAKSKDIQLEVFRPDRFELIVTRDGRKSILIDGKARDLPDFIMPRMGAETTYFALAVVRQLEYLGVYSCNSSVSTEAVKDKLYIHQMLAHSNLPTPKTMLVKFPVDTAIVKKELGFPVIVKNVTGMRGTGVYLSETENRFVDLIDLIESQNSKANIILQEFVKHSKGNDLRVFVVGGKVVGCMRRVAKEGFKANVSRGGSAEVFELTPEVEWLATETARLVGLDISGIDLLFEEDGYKICEANSAPGFKGLEKVVGECVAEHILDYIKVRLGHTL